MLRAHFTHPELTRLVICTTGKPGFQASPLKAHRHTQGVQLTLVKPHQQVRNRMSLSSVTYIITNQSRSQRRKTSNSTIRGKKSPSTSYTTGQIHEKNVVMISKVSTEHPGKCTVTINSTMHVIKCALLLMETSEGFLYSREQN